MQMTKITLNKSIIHSQASEVVDFMSLDLKHHVCSMESLHDIFHPSVKYVQSVCLQPDNVPYACMGDTALRIYRLYTLDT